uniref:Uncharacterized protein n=1 Tax=Aegilops tauschii TaxID=37682 RepID=M8B9U9_AEGTA
MPALKAEEARIAQEIQKKREKDGRDTELDKHKMMNVLLYVASNLFFELVVCYLVALGCVLASNSSTRNIEDLGAHLCRPVVGNGLFLQGGALHPLPDKDHHDVQLHLGVLFPPEGIPQELLLQCLGGGHRIPGDHLRYLDPHHPGGDFPLGEDLHHLGDVDHHLLIAVGPQLAHLEDHHLLRVADHLLDTDYQQIGTGPHRQEDAGHGPHHLSSSPHSRSPNRSRRSSSRDAEKGTNGAPSTKGRDLAQSYSGRSLSYSQYCLRNQERSGRESPDFEHRRLTKSLRSPTNDAKRDSTRGSPLKDTGKHMPSQDSTNTSGDEEEGGRARENARKANSSRRVSKDFSADLQLKEVNVDNSIPGEKPSSRSRQYGGKDVPKKYDNQLSDSSEDALDGRRMKRQGDSPDDSPVKRQSPSRAGDSYPKDGINNERAKTDSFGASYDAIAAKKYSGKVDEAFQSDGGSPLQKAKKRTYDSKHIDHGSSGSEESEKHRSQSEKRGHKKGHKHKKHYDDSSDSDSYSDDKESKRRRREEKKLRKEERRLRREERHRRRADRHASKQKLKYAGSPLSDLEKDRQSGSDADVGKKGSYTPREEPDPNKLEIELRQRALESLAKKSKHVVTPSSDVEKDRESDSDADVRKRVS